MNNFISIGQSCHIYLFFNYKLSNQVFYYPSSIFLTTLSIVLLLLYYMISPFQFSPTSPISNNIQSINQQEFFHHQILKIDQYIQLLENDPIQAKISQLVCQKGFYKSELKAALHLNSIFVQMCQSKESLIQQLYAQIRQIKKKHDSENIEQSFDKCQNSINKGNINTPKRKIKSALTAQRHILDAKFSQQIEQYKKIIQQSNELLKNQQQENKYLREKLLILSQQIILQKNRNSELNKLNQQILSKNKELTKKLNEKMEKCSNNLLDFSPITKKGELVVEQDISFNQYCLIEDNNESQLLKKQIQELKNIIKQLKDKYQQTQNQIILSKSIPYYQELENKYLEIQKDLTEKLSQLQKYKDIASQITQIQKISKNYSQQKRKWEEQINILKSKLEYYESDALNIDLSYQQCKQCEKLKVSLFERQKELLDIREEIFDLKMKLNKTIHLQLNQRKQWDQFLKGIDQSSGQ